MIKSLEDIIDWDACSASDPMTEVINAVNWLKKRGYAARYRITERDSFGPVCVLITAEKDGQQYDYLY